MMPAATIILGLLWYVLACSALSVARAASYRRSHYHMPITRSRMAAWQAGNAPIDYND